MVNTVKYELQAAKAAKKKKSGVVDEADYAKMVRELGFGPKTLNA